MAHVVVGETPPGKPESDRPASPAEPRTAEPPAARSAEGEPTPADRPAAAEPAPPEPAPAHGWAGTLRTRAVELLAVLPALYMVRRVHLAPLMPFQDYWDAFYRITNPDGSPRWRGFFTYTNEHPFAVPGLVFYLGARLSDGNNRLLGYYVVVIAAVAVLLLRSVLPRQWSPMTRAWLTVAISLIVFCPAGLWNFSRGMSGTAWLTANLFAIVAIVLAARRWTILAVCAACLAVLSYGTGFGAFVAIAGVALIRREAKWRWILPLGVLAAGALVYLATSNGGTSGGGVSRNPALLTSTFLSNLGLLWAPENAELARILGAGGLVLLALAASVAWRRRDLDDLAPWWALGAYAIVAAGLVSLSRSEVFNGVGVQSRYASLPELFWIAVMIVVLRVLLAGRPIVVRVAPVAASVLVFYAASTPLAAQAIGVDPVQNLLATAVRVDAADSFGARFLRPDEVTARLKALGDFPFSDRYSLGCGHLVPGDRIPVSSIRPLPATAGQVDSDKTAQDARQITGWLSTFGTPVRCVLAVDADGTIVGGGVYGFARPDVARVFPGAGPNGGWQVIMPAAERDARVVFGFDDGYRSLAKAP